MKKKYVAVKVSKIITQIAVELSPGYTKGVIEIFFPDDKELSRMSDGESDAWIEENNKRMTRLLEVMNDENL